MTDGPTYFGADTAPDDDDDRQVPLEASSDGASALSAALESVDDFPVEQAAEPTDDGLPPSSDAPSKASPQRVGAGFSTDLRDVETLEVCGRTTVHLCRTTVPWRLAVDALAVPTSPGHELGNLGIEMQLDGYQLVQLSRPVYSDAPEGFFTSRVPGAHIELRDLPAASSRSELHVIYTTAHDGSQVTPETSGLAVEGVLKYVNGREIRTLALPLVGAGAAGLDPTEVARQTVNTIRSYRYGPEHIVLIAPDDETAEIIRFVISRPRSPRPNNDLATGPDHLRIGAEASAIADMITLRSAEPPLAVGVIGDWGSGKSFFMHLIEQRIAELRAEPIAPVDAWSSDPNDQPDQAGHTYTVRFNAWTYAKTSLWAALMKQILEQLDEQMSLEQDLIAVAQGIAGEQSEQEALIDEKLALVPSLLALDEHERRVGVEMLKRNAGLAVSGASDSRSLATIGEEQAADAEREIVELEALLTRERQRIAAQAEAEFVRTRSDAIWQSLRSSLSSTFYKIPQVAALADDGRDLEEVISDVRVDGRAIARDVENGRAFWIPAFVIGTIATVVTGAAVAMAALTAEWLVGTGLVTALLAVVGNAASKTLRFAARFRDAVRCQRAAIARVKAEAFATKVEISDRLAETDLALLELHQRHATARAALDAARKLTALSKNVEPLNEIVRRRTADHNYNDHLGLIHEVHKDLEALAAPLSLAQAAPSNSYSKHYPRGVPRIIVFVDDLDRCPPDRVVEVFEAAQLLLKSDLFVLVIGIDDRYVTRSLESKYGGVLDRHNPPTGHDYLEKIIQIPYRLRSVDSDALPGYVESLITEQSSTRERPEADKADHLASTEVRDESGGQLEAKTSIQRPRTRDVVTFDDVEQQHIADQLRDSNLTPRTIKPRSTDRLSVCGWPWACGGLAV